MTNRAPVTQNDVFTAQVGFTLYGQKSVLANDSDPDGDTLSVSAVQGSGGAGTLSSDGSVFTVQGAYGTLTIAPNGQYGYLARTGGVDVFTYTASDGHGGTTTATLTVDARSLKVIVPEFNATSGTPGSSPPSTPDPGYATTPLIASVGSGAFAVTYTDFNESAPSSEDRNDSFLDGYDATGHLQHSTQTDAAAVAMSPLANGGAAELFYSYDTGYQGSSGHFELIPFGANGASGAATVISQTTSASSAGEATLSTLSNGTIAVALIDSPDTSNELSIQLHSASGTALGQAVTANTKTTTYSNGSTGLVLPSQPALAGLTGGGFVAAWCAGYGTSQTGIEARLFDSNGSPSGQEFTIAPPADNVDIVDPAVIGLTNGGFAVAWRETTPNSNAPSEFSFGIQVFDASGNRVGNEAKIDIQDDNAPSRPVLAALASGRFVVVWDASPNVSALSDDNQAQVFDSSGVAQGQPYIVSDDADGNQEAPAVTGLGGDTFAVAWHSYDDPNDVETVSIKSTVVQYVPPGTTGTTVSALTIAGDDVINPSEAAATTVPVIGSLSAAIASGQAVVVDLGGTEYATTVNGTSFTTNVATPTVAGTVTAHVVQANGTTSNDATTTFRFGAGSTARGDFSGYGRSDLLWRNTNGDLVIYTSTGSGFTSTDFGIIGTAWVNQTSGDFSGDGKADLLWRNSNGDVVVWTSTGSNFTSKDYGVVGTDWAIKGTGDFNGDGKADIVWRNTDGTVVTWASTGSGFTSSTIGKVGNDWTIQGTGDFDGDGKSDVLWRNTNGEVVTWTSTGSGFASHDIGNVSNDWHIAGTGDVDGDGKSDILWRNDSGEVDVWHATPSGFAGQDIGKVSTDWSIAQVGDFSGDGKSDIAWRNSNGDLVTWTSTGSGFASKDYGIVGTAWHIVG